MYYYNNHFNITPHFGVNTKIAINIEFTLKTHNLYFLILFCIFLIKTFILIMVKFMIILIYIFLSKIIENAIATLRLIVVSNGKKMLGAILNLIISIIWIISTSLVVVNNDIFKIIVFALGSFLGSLIGSIMEEKIAIGSNMLFTITSIEKTEEIKNELNNLKYNTYILNSNDKNILIIMVLRKNRKQVLDLIRNIDNKAIIISETARQLAFKK